MTIRGTATYLFSHEHADWEPIAVLREPGRICPCGYYEQITKAHFKQLFRRSFWSWLKMYEDRYVFGGYLTQSKRRQRGI